MSGFVKVKNVRFSQGVYKSEGRQGYVVKNSNTKVRTPEYTLDSLEMHQLNVVNEVNTNSDNETEESCVRVSDEIKRFQNEIKRREQENVLWRKWKKDKSKQWHTLDESDSAICRSGSMDSLLETAENQKVDYDVSYSNSYKNRSMDDSSLGTKSNSNDKLSKKVSYGRNEYIVFEERGQGEEAQSESAPFLPSVRDLTSKFQKKKQETKRIKPNIEKVERIPEMLKVSLSSGKNNQVHSLTARSVSKEFRDGLKAGKSKVTDTIVKLPDHRDSSQDSSVNRQVKQKKNGSKFKSGIQPPLPEKYNKSEDYTMKTKHYHPSNTRSDIYNVQGYSSDESGQVYSRSNVTDDRRSSRNKGRNSRSPAQEKRRQSNSRHNLDTSVKLSSSSRSAATLSPPSLSSRSGATLSPPSLSSRSGATLSPPPLSSRSGATLSPPPLSKEWTVWT